MSGWIFAMSRMPIVSRFFAGTLLCTMPGGGQVWARPPAATDGQPRRLTEAQAVERALANPNLSDLRLGLVEQAKAEGLERTRWQDPSLSYSREQLLSGSPLGEDYAALSQTFDVLGRRALHRKAASARSDAAEHRAEVVAADLAALTRHSYYRLLAAQERHALLKRWREQVQSYLAIVERREKAGDAAAYDRLRLQRELTRIDALVEREGATVRSSWLRLHGLVDPGGVAREPPALEGALLPAGAPRAAPMVEAPAAPEFRAAESEARALAFDCRAASRWWVPSPNLGAGYKGVDLPGGGRAHGFMVSVAVPIPILDRQRAERARASAQARFLAAETNLEATRVRAVVSALAEQIARLSHAARAMHDRNAAEDDALLRAAESGYHGGEIGVMELLDAYRSSIEAQLMALDLALAARQAEIDLRRRTEGAPS